MGKQKRAQPELLPAKLLYIRKQLGLSQPQMLHSLNLKQDLSVGRISEYERGIREPTDELIDDDIDVDDLRVMKPRI